MADKGVRITIQNGAVGIDIVENLGVFFLGCSNIFGAPLKKCATSSYVEESGEHSAGTAVKDAFDFTLRIGVSTQNATANSVIADINELISRSGKLGEMTIELKDKRLKIVGYPESISEVKKFYRIKGSEDFAEIEMKIRVTNPDLCDFNYSSPNTI